MTLMELLVAGTISIIVSSGMVVLMASTLGTGTQTIKMTQLSAEMRTAMQIITRELRRANYHSTYANCFGDANCLINQSIDAKVTEVSINAGGDCFGFGGIAALRQRVGRIISEDWGWFSCWFVFLALCHRRINVLPGQAAPFYCQHQRRRPFGCVNYQERGTRLLYLSSWRSLRQG